MPTEPGSPGPPPRAPLDRVRALSVALAGEFHAGALLDRIVSELKATFAPSAAAGVLVDQQGRRESASGDAVDPALAAALTDALAQPAVLERRSGRATVLAARLAGGDTVHGAVGLTFDDPPPSDASQLLAALASVAALALAGAHAAAAGHRRTWRWEEAADAVPFALCLMDADGRVERCNRAFHALVRLEPGEEIGRDWRDLVPPEWHPELTRLLAPVAPRQVALRQGEATLTVYAFASGPAAEGGRILVVSDETERQRLQDRLIQSEKLSAIGQLIAGVAHDLNNPLTSVVGFADFLAEGDEAPPRLREPLRVIQQEAERASKIVKNLLSFARRQETRQVVSLRPIIDATCGLFRGPLEAEGIALVAECDPDLPELELNPGQMQQVFVNLIQNAAQAIKAGGRPGTVRLRAGRWMEGAAVEVRDDGPGMTAQVAAQVFEPFFTTRAEAEGTGLGLSISQGIVKEHGGRIALVTAPGEGASFTVQLPGRGSIPAVPQPLEEGGALRPLRVLVVDDEPHILHYIRTTLEAWGHAVETALDGQAGLDRATAEPFDLIITDLRMPRLGGRQLFEALRARAPAAARRVVFTTGDTVRGDTLAFLDAAGRPCLNKPFSLSELRALLRNASRAP